MAIDERTQQAVSHWTSQLGISETVILAVIMTESGGNPNAQGAAGEIGLMQLMPATAAAYGVSRDQLYDPYYNVQAGATFLRDLINKYGLEGGIQAYNLGETKFLKGSTSPTYLAKVLGNLSSLQPVTDVASVYPTEYQEVSLISAGLTSNPILFLAIGVGIALFLIMWTRR